MFDPYHRWLAIPRDQRPPTYYQLLGIAPGETDAEVIAEAALRQTSHVRTYQTGPHAQQCQALLNELGQAKVTLMHPEKRKAYDARLGLRKEPGPEPVGIPPKAGPTEEDRLKPVLQLVVPEGGAFPFDPFSARKKKQRYPDDDTEGAGTIALAYLALLLLGALLAFWLSGGGP